MAASLITETHLLAGLLCFLGANFRVAPVHDQLARKPWDLGAGAYEGRH